MLIVFLNNIKKKLFLPNTFKNHLNNFDKYSYYIKGNAAITDVVHKTSALQKTQKYL